MDTTPSKIALRALRATLILALGASSACVGDDGKDSGHADTDSTPASSACEGSTPILNDAGAPTGFERCADGAIHRASAETTSADIDLPACVGDENTLYCTTDADCTSGPNGRCYHDDYVVMGGKVQAPDTGSNDGCFCAYSCVSDADCAEGQACVPGGVVTKTYTHATCETAECRTDSDCASGECGISSFDDGCGYDTVLACRESSDTCRSDADCATEGGECAYGGDQTFACRTGDCDIGRPLLVEGRARYTRPTRRGDWVAEVEVEVLEPELQRALGRWWREIAALEHASVASFARFTLQLMALGAPPDLLAETQRAALDEIEHARLCYGLASQYLGEAVGPGPLSLRDVGVETSPVAVLVGLIEEACVGETLGAAEARHAAELVEHEGLRSVLSRIADDEARHAALAWRALRWLLEREPALAEVAARTFEDAARRVREGAGVASPDAAAQGVLGVEARRQVHLAALEQVVLPCAALLENEIISTRHLGRGEA